MSDRAENAIPSHLITRLLRLAHDLHTLPPTGPSRRHAMLQGLCELTGAHAAESALLHLPPAGQPRLLSPITLTADASDRHRPPRPLLTTASDEPLLDPAIGQLLARISRTRPTITHSRRSLIPDRAYLASPFVNRASHRAREPDALYSLRTVGPARAHTHALLCLTRSAARRSPFAPTAVHLTHLFHSESAWLYEPLPLPASGVSSDALTPRQQDCLRHLLLGHSEKQIASSLRLSPHTVHVHIKSIYRHLNVSTRAELMAHFLPQNHRP